MSKRTLSNATACVLALSILTLCMGCVDRILGPESHKNAGTPVEHRMPPEIQPVEPAYAPAKADLTGDRRVDAADLAAFAAMLAADLNGDRAVDARDVKLLGAVLDGLPVDVNDDGLVDASDIAAYARAKGWAELTGNGRIDASDVAAFAAKRGKGDVNGDGNVNSLDLAVIQRHLGQEVEPIGAI